MKNITQPSEVMRNKMNNLIVFYPTDFRAYSKFKRKLMQLTQNMGNFHLYFSQEHGDPNHFCQQIFHEQAQCLACDVIEDWQSNEITHAIFFDDGEDFADQKAFFSALEVPMRTITIKITRVVNIKRETQYQGLRSTPNFEYIGRGSYWGNPHSRRNHNIDDEYDDREEMIRKYQYDFDYDKFPNRKGIKQNARALAGKRLGCFCKPYRCHGDVIADYLNGLDDGK